MVPVPQALILKLKKKYPKPSIDPTWLQDCYDWVVGENNLNAGQVDAAFDHVELQFLGSDLADSTVDGTGFPPNLPEIENGRIATPNTGGAIVCQLTALTDIGHSAFSLRNIRQARIDKADMAGLAAQEEGDEDGNPPDDGEDYSIPKYPRATLQLLLSDGHRTVPAIEYRKLPSLQLGETPLGCKVILRNVLIRRGIAFLDPESVTIIPGTRVEEMDEMRDVLFSRGLRLRMGLPEIDADEEELHRQQQAADPVLPQAQAQPPVNPNPPPAPAPAPIQQLPPPAPASTSSSSQPRARAQPGRANSGPGLSEQAKAERRARLKQLLDSAPSDNKGVGGAPVVEASGSGSGTSAPVRLPPGPVDEDPFEDEDFDMDAARDAYFAADTPAAQGPAPVSKKAPAPSTSVPASRSIASTSDSRTAPQPPPRRADQNQPDEDIDFVSDSDPEISAHFSQPLPPLPSPPPQRARGMTPAQEIAYNDAALRQLDRLEHRARSRSASPVKGSSRATSPVKERQRTVAPLAPAAGTKGARGGSGSTAARAGLREVIEIDDSDSMDDKEEKVPVQRKPAPAPTPQSKPSASAPSSKAAGKTTLTASAKARRVAKIASVIDLSD